MDKKIILIIAVVAVLLAGGFWFMNQSNQSSLESNVNDTTEPMSGDDDLSELDSSSDSSTDSAMSQNADEIMIMTSSYKFEPAEIRAKVGETVRVRLMNNQGTHNFTIDDLNVESQTIQQGADTVVEFTPTQAGEFEYYCSVGNHRAQGMVGKLIVEE